MTVAASPADVPPQGYNTGLGRGAQLLADIASIQALVTAAANPAVQAALVDRLNRLQIEAVDWFMMSFWVAADQILAEMATGSNDMRVMPAAGDAWVIGQLSAISARQATVDALVAAGTPALPANGTQYTKAYPPPNSAYPLTEPDVLLYQLQTQLVDYYMAKAYLPASLILSHMTGTQTYPFNGYQSGYTMFQQYVEGPF